MHDRRGVRAWVLGVCLLPGTGFLLLFFGLPLLRVVWGSFQSDDPGAPAITLANWVRLFSDPVLLDGLRFSLWLGIAPTAISLAISLPLSALIQANARAQRLARTLYRIPLVVPGIIAAFMVLVVFDLGGMASRIATPLGIQLPRLVRDSWGIGVIMALCWKTIPFMTLIIAGSMAAINPDIPTAARTLGAGRMTVLLRVQIPLAQAGITAAVLLSFIQSLGTFVVPSLLGPAYPLPLSVHMYNEGFQRGNWNLVYAMGSLLSVMAIAVLLSYYALLGTLSRSPGKR